MLQIIAHKVSISKCVYRGYVVFDCNTFMVPKGGEDLRQPSPYRASLQPECVSGCPHAGVKCKLACDRDEGEGGSSKDQGCYPASLSVHFTRR